MPGDRGAGRLYFWNYRSGWSVGGERAGALHAEIFRIGRAHGKGLGREPGQGAFLGGRRSAQGRGPPGGFRFSRGLWHPSVKWSAAGSAPCAFRPPAHGR